MRRSDGPWPLYEILPGRLFQRGKLHHFSPEVKARGLAHYRITRSVALAPPRPDPDLVKLPTHLHLPIPDGLLHDGPKLLALADRLASEIAAGGAVLTLCNAGRNRSGLLSALVARAVLGLSGPEAVALVQQERPRALANPVFVDYLNALEAP